MKCSTLHCEKTVHSRDLCKRCYNRKRVNGEIRTKFRRRNGEGTISDGYHKITRATKTTKVHRDIVERALGKPIPSESIVHHVNGISFANTNDNLVLCPDRAYHNLLHRRQAALDSCGNANWLKCNFCHEYDDLDNMAVGERKNRSSGTWQWHRACKVEFRRQKKLVG